MDAANDFGRPDDQSGGYQVCVYDETASTPAPVLGFFLESQASCTGTCWTANHAVTALKYKNKTGSAAGVITALFKGGAIGKGKIVLESKGAAIPLPSPVSGTEFFAQDPRVTVRLTALDTRKCWQSVFDTGTTKKNVVTQFTAVLK